MQRQPCIKRKKDTKTIYPIDPLMFLSINVLKKPSQPQPRQQGKKYKKKKKKKKKTTKESEASIKILRINKNLADYQRQSEQHLHTFHLNYLE